MRTRGLRGLPAPTTRPDLKPIPLRRSLNLRRHGGERANGVHAEKPRSRGEAAGSRACDTDVNTALGDPCDLPDPRGGEMPS